MEKDVVVIGLGIFGHEVAVQLQEKGKKVLAVDVDEAEIHRIRDHVTGAVIASVTDEEALAALDLSKFEFVILGLGSNFEQLVLGITYLRKLGVKYIIARANTEIQQEILLKIGANEVILPEKHSAQRLAERIARPNIAEMLEIDENVNLAEIKVDDRLADKTLRELDLRRKYNITALLLKRDGQRPRVITDPELKLLAGDYLVVLGTHDDILNTFS